MTPDDPTPPDGTARPGDLPARPAGPEPRTGPGRAAPARSDQAPGPALPPADDPAANPGGRNRPADAAVPGEDLVVARLRSALDELTAGAEPNSSRVTPLASGRERRWLLPAVAAAAVLAVVGVAVAVVGRGGGPTPAAPTPSGSPVPTQPPAGTATIPWYELQAEGATPEPALDQTGTDPLRTQVWTTAAFERILVATVTDDSDATSSELDAIEPPIGATAVDGVAGAAWIVSSMASGVGSAASPYAVWLPDDRTAINLLGHGLDAEVLRQLVLTGSVSRDEHGARFDSPLASLEPIADAATPLGLVTQPYTLADGTEASVMVATEGPAFVLRTYASWVSTIAPVHTPFGDGVRLDVPEATQVWWQVDDGPAWAGFAAPPDRFDELFAEVARVPGIATPHSSTLPTDPATNVAPCEPPPGSTTSAEVSSPSDLATRPGDTSSTTTTAPCRAEPMATTTSLPPQPSFTTTSTTLSRPLAPDSDGVATTTIPGGAAPGMREPTITAVAPSSVASPWRPPIAVGESVMLSAVQALGARGIEVHASEAVQAAGIGEQLELLRDTDRLGDVVIVQVGTNGTVTDADLDRIMAALTEVERVVVLTVHADRSWIAPNNELIRALPSRYPNVTIADWDQLAVAEPGILASDGIHVEDRDAYADAIAAAAGLT